ncbi:unnamed protein product, partial [Ectocarpus sp. 8 AP-2014]
MARRAQQRHIFDGVSCCRVLRLAITTTWGFCSTRIALGLDTPSTSSPPAAPARAAVGAATGAIQGWTSVALTPQRQREDSKGGANSGPILNGDLNPTLGQGVGHRRLSTSLHTSFSDDYYSFTPYPAPTPSCGGAATIGDGVCDADNNTEDCGYDGGDCCICTCASSADGTCGSSGYYCLDPSAPCWGAG